MKFPAEIEHLIRKSIDQLKAKIHESHVVPSTGAFRSESDTLHDQDNDLPPGGGVFKVALFLINNIKNSIPCGTTAKPRNPPFDLVSAGVRHYC